MNEARPAVDIKRRGAFSRSGRKPQTPSRGTQTASLSPPTCLPGTKVSGYLRTSLRRIALLPLVLRPVLDDL